MKINWKRVGYLLGIILALGPVYISIALSALDMPVPAAGVIERPDGAISLPPGMLHIYAIVFIGTFVLLPVGALLIVMCLGMLQRGQRILELDDSGKQGYRDLARRRTIGWGIDRIVVPFAVTALLYLFAGGRPGISAGFSQLFTLVYLLFKDAGTGRSIGKMMTGIKTVGNEGRPPGLLQSFKRNVPMLLPVLPWIAGANIWAFRPQRIGEK